MDILGYRPDQVARSQGRCEIHTLGLDVADITNPFNAVTAGLRLSHLQGDI